MKIKIKQSIIILFLFASGIFPQSETHQWKPLIINDSMKTWFDANMVDSIGSDIFSIWFLELHKPPLEFEGFKSKITRSKTLYLVNKSEMKYGIDEVVYYDQANREIERFKYNLAKLEEEFRYTFPILNNKLFDKFFSELNKSKERKTRFK